MSTNALFSYCFDGRDKYSFIIIITIMHYAKEAAPQYIQETHQDMRDPNVTSLYFATPLAFNAPTEGFPGTISVKYCVEVRGWLRYKMANKYCRKFLPSK